MVIARIDQFYPAVADGESISTHIVDIQGMLRRLGYQSDIFVEQLPIHFQGQVRPKSEYESLAAPNQLLLIHFGLVYSDAVMDWLKLLPSHLILIYHNITPHHYFAGINPFFFEAAQRGREQLAALSQFTTAAWGDSAYNTQDLDAYGWSQRAVLPIAFDPERMKLKADETILKRWQGGLNILYVGRVSPNKRIEDLLLTFYYLKRNVAPKARLFIVGSAGGMERYMRVLQALQQKLNLSDVLFTGHVSAAQWLAYYQCASIYVSMSEHEGFGMPFLEAIHFDIPVMAYKAAAVPETLGDAGVLITQKRYAKIAELIGLILEDNTFRTKILAKQRERLQDFHPAVVQAKLATLIKNFQSQHQNPT